MSDVNREPMRLSYPGIELALTPEAVRLNDLAMVHACLTKSLIHCFRRDDPEAFAVWVLEVLAIVEAEQARWGGRKEEETGDSRRDSQEVRRNREHPP